MDNFCNCFVECLLKLRNIAMYKKVSIFLYLHGLLSFWQLLSNAIACTFIFFLSIVSPSYMQYKLSCLNWFYFLFFNHKQTRCQATLSMLQLKKTAPSKQYKSLTPAVKFLCGLYALCQIYAEIQFLQLKALPKHPFIYFYTTPMKCFSVKLKGTQTIF